LITTTDDTIDYRANPIGCLSHVFFLLFNFCSCFPRLVAMTFLFGWQRAHAREREREREKSICFMSVCKIKAKKNKTTAFQFFLMISTFQHPFGFVRQPSEFFSEFQMGAHDLFAIIFYTSPCMFYIYAPPVSPFLRKIFNKNKNREREREKTTLQFLWFQVL
jgi:Na+/melibiose symporter-like transporter